MGFDIVSSLIVLFVIILIILNLGKVTYILLSTVLIIFCLLAVEIFKIQE